MTTWNQKDYGHLLEGSAQTLRLGLIRTSLLKSQEKNVGESIASIAGHLVESILFHPLKEALGWWQSERNAWRAGHELATQPAFHVA